MATFALRLVHGPAWDGARGIREQAGWDEHAAFMDALVADGFLVLGGPLGDGRETLHAVVADDAEEVRRRMAADPWAGGLLLVGEVTPWQWWLDGRDR